MARGRDKQAQRNLERINQGDPNYDSNKALWEFKEDVRRSEESGGGSWMSLFTDRVELRKLVSTFGVLAGQQIGGVQFIFSYATVIATDLQLANPFLITIIVRLPPIPTFFITLSLMSSTFQIDIIEVLGVVAGFFIIERMGRKTLILWCSAVEIVSMLIIGGLASGPQIAPTVPPKAFGQAAIGFIVRTVFLRFMLLGRPSP